MKQKLIGLIGLVLLAAAAALTLEHAQAPAAPGCMTEPDVRGSDYLGQRRCAAEASAEAAAEEPIASR